jgi:hypothetical protein
MCGPATGPESDGTPPYDADCLSFYIYLAIIPLICSHSFFSLWAS